MGDINYQKRISDAMIKICEIIGCPARTHRKLMIPKYIRDAERDAWKYVMEIEEEHKKAARSKTRFGSGYCFA